MAEAGQAHSAREGTEGSPAPWRPLAGEEGGSSPSCPGSPVLTGLQGAEHRASGLWAAAGGSHRGQPPGAAAGAGAAVEKTPP